MIKPKLETHHGRKETRFRIVGVVLAVVIILTSAIAWVASGPASTGTGVDSPQYGVHVAKPESMKQFPSELIPVP